MRSTDSPTIRLLEATPGVRRLGVAELLRLRRGSLLRLEERHRELEPRSIPLIGRNFVYLREPDDVEWMFRQRPEVLSKDAGMQALRRLLGNGLLVSEGDFWRRQRGLMAHAFTPRRVMRYGAAMAGVAERFAASLGEGDELVIHDAMNRVTLEIVARTLFDTDVSGAGGEVGVALEAIMAFFENSAEAMLRLPDWTPTRRMRRFVAARIALRAIVDGIIEARRADPSEHDDLLGALLAPPPDGAAPMSDEQIRDECLTLFLAGHETTSLLLAHTFAALSERPDVAARIRDEAARVLGDREATADDIKAMPFTERVVTEALRLYPSAWTVTREAKVDVTIQGRTFPPGTQLVACQWAMQRDPRFYPEPEVFDPDRWLPERRKRIPRGAYFPFGDGARVCIGNHFALLESALVLVAVVRRWQLETAPGQTLAFAPSITLRAERGLHMRVRQV